MTNNMDSHNPEKIIQQANEKYNNNDFEGAQMVYQSALLEWQDDASFGVSDPATVQHISEGIATLWIEFANLNRKAEMFKAATEAFMNAVNCPLAGSMGRVWKEYAKYQQARNKNKTAQKVYLKALVGENGNPGAVVKENERDELWDDFLQMMRRLHKDDTLSLQALKDAVQVEHGARAKVKDEPVENNVQVPLPTSVPLPDNIATMMKPGMEPAVKRARLEDFGGGMPFPSDTSAITASAVEAVALELLGKTSSIPPEVTAEWLATDGDAMPSRPEPPLFTPSPPRLSDPSGKELLGTENSLKLIQLLADESNGNLTGNAILQICQGCWMMSALKEREAAQCVKALDKKLADDFGRMEEDLEARLKVAGAALAAVQQINANEKESFLAACNQQRQQLEAQIAWEFRQLLSTQQLLLTNAGIPEFNGPTAASISIYKQSIVCSFLHSAFFLRNRVGEKNHIAMLKKQQSKLASEQPSPMPLPPALPQHFPPQGSFPMMQVPPPPPPPPFVQGVQYR